MFWNVPKIGNVHRSMSMSRGRLDTLLSNIYLTTRCIAQMTRQARLASAKLLNSALAAALVVKVPSKPATRKMKISRKIKAGPIPKVAAAPGPCPV